MYRKGVILSVLTVIRTEFHLRRIYHLRKEIRKMRMETIRHYNDIDALIEHILRIHGKIRKCILRGGYSRGRDLDGLMSDMIETLNLRDYGQVLHQQWVDHNYYDAIRAFVKIISTRGVMRVVIPLENMVLRSGRIVKHPQYRKEILYSVPCELKYSLYKSHPLLGIYMLNVTVL